jgi:hypothetical protein
VTPIFFFPQPLMAIRLTTKNFFPLFLFCCGPSPDYLRSVVVLVPDFPNSAAWLDAGLN